MVPIAISIATTNQVPIKKLLMAAVVRRSKVTITRTKQVVTVVLKRIRLVVMKKIKIIVLLGKLLQRRRLLIMMLRKQSRIPISKRWTI